MTTTAQFEYAIKNGLSNRQAKRRYGKSSEKIWFAPVARGVAVKGTGKKKGTAKK